MYIEHLPPILIIHLKCFLYDEIRGIKKLNKSINYTVNLTLPKSKKEILFCFLFLREEEEEKKQKI